MKRLTALAAVVFLSACGGGGSDSTPTTQTPATAQSAEGFWSGTTTDGTVVNLAVLENGEAWGLYGTSSSLVGALYGTTTVSGSSLSGSGRGFNFSTQTASSATITGTVTSKANINIVASDGSQFTGTYDAGYDQPATIANFAGTYSGLAVTGSIAPQATTVVVDASGNVSSSYVSGTNTCNTTGTATPRASGKNVANLQLTFTGNSCALGNGTTVTGVATYNPTKRQIIAMGLNTGKTDGLIFIGTK